MVAINNIEDDYGQNPKTLCDWVKNIRLKKIQMKRKLRSGGNLRVCAILSTALMNAELELRRKQQERFQKWLEFQAKIDKNHEFQHHEQREDTKQSEAIANLWKNELCDLDNFMRSISSSSNQTQNGNVERDNSYQNNQMHSIVRVSS